MGTLSYVTYEIDHILGGNTDVVDSSKFKTASEQIAFINVNVLTADAQSMRANQTVLVNGSSIEKVGESLPIPKGYQVVDGNGRYLIPGLIDSHVHI